MNVVTEECVAENHTDIEQAAIMNEEQDTDALTNAIYELVTTQWKMQTGNYNIEDNYPGLIPTISFAERQTNEIIQDLVAITGQCQTIMDMEKPKREQRLESPFNNNIMAPIPNNPVVGAFLGAILHGGKDARRLDAGWMECDDRVVYGVENRVGGKISIGFSEENSLSIDEQWKTIESLSLFTADVTIGILAHICKNYYDNRNSRPIHQETIISSKRLLKDRGIKAFGKKSWGLKETVSAEINKIQNFRISIENYKDPISPVSKTYNQTFQLIASEVVHRVYDKNTCTYIPTVWKVRPGSWASIWMSTASSEFIGKLHKNIYQLDHREQRSADCMAKKLGYMLFTVPGGTYYLKNGVRKTIKAYLSVIGEFIRPMLKKNVELGRRINRLCYGFEKLSEIDIVDLISLPHRVTRRKSHSATKTLSEMIDIRVKKESGIAPSKNNKG